MTKENRPTILSRMARVVNVYEAKTQLSRLIDEAHAGREIVVAKNGKPWARLVPIQPLRSRPLGFLRSKVKVTKEFFEPLPEEELAVWE